MLNYIFIDPFFMRKSDIVPMPIFFDRYIHLVEDIEIIDALQQSKDYLVNLNRSAYRVLANHSYAINK